MDLFDDDEPEESKPTPPEPQPVIAQTAQTITSSDHGQSSLRPIGDGIQQQVAPQVAQVHRPSQQPPLLSNSTPALPSNPATASTITVAAHVPPPAPPASLDPIIPDDGAFKAKVLKLRDIANDLDLSSAFPAALVEYYLKSAGCEVVDKAILKLVGLEVQNVLQEVLKDAKDLSALRVSLDRKKSKKAKLQTDSEAPETKVLVLQNTQVQTVLSLKHIPATYAPFHPGSEAQ